jgi:hypothetical protein
MRWRRAAAAQRVPDADCAADLAHAGPALDADLGALAGDGAAPLATLDAEEEAELPALLRLKLGLLRLMVQLLAAGPRACLCGNADPTSVLMQARRRHPGEGGGGGRQRCPSFVRGNLATILFVF